MLTNSSSAIAWSASDPLPVEQQPIERLLPHRAPMLMLDRVREMTPDVEIVASKTIASDEPWCAGHFPGRPILPGVMLLEGMAQAAHILGEHSGTHEKGIYALLEITEARFRKPVLPGDVVVYHVKLVKRRSPFFWFEARVEVKGQVVATARLSAGRLPTHK